MLWHKCRCGVLISQAQKQCDACEIGQTGQSRHMEYNRYRRNKKAAAFYIDTTWRQTRSVVLQLYDGLDLYAYYIQHKLITADMVHHVIELEEDWERRLDLNNLIPLSNKNHGIISALYKKDAATKKQTQAMLFDLMHRHKEQVGVSKKFLNIQN